MQKRKILVYVAIALFAIALFLPGIRFMPGEYHSPEDISVNCGAQASCITTYSAPEGSDVSVYYGYGIFLLGALGALIGNFAWYANIILVISIILGFTLSSRRFAIIGILSSLIGFAVAMDSYLLRSVPLDEGGVMELHVDHLSSGFYVWVASFIVLLVYFITLYFQQKISPENDKSGQK